MHNGVESESSNVIQAQVHVIEALHAAGLQVPLGVELVGDHDKQTIAQVKLRLRSGAEQVRVFLAPARARDRARLYVLACVTDR